MNIVRTNSKNKRTKKCIHPWCNVQITDSVSKKQCTTPECIQKRKELIEIEKEFTPTTVSNNLILRKRISCEKTVNLRCCAKGKKGRCKNHFVITLRISQKVYPKYCPEHRNEYKRKRFETTL